MQQTIDQLRDQVQHDLKGVASSEEVEKFRIKYLGKKGPIQQLMKQLRTVSTEERPEMGKMINDLKVEVAEALDQLLRGIVGQEESLKLADEAMDVTLPGRRSRLGSSHILSQYFDSIIDILVGMGFSVQLGPEVETEYYNFDALNFQPDHPAKDMQDTFYVAPDVLLRTHTSNSQIRVMEKHKPPIRIIAPGRCYRNEAISTRSHVLFHQVEGLYVDKGVTFSDLMGTLDQFLQAFFKKPVKTRHRPSYFPFVEPGMETDISCLKCDGAGCQLCKYTGWLEVGGSGMVHPEVLKNCGIDPEEYSGYAWGMGLERLVMLCSGVDDIRLFLENDLRFLKQFPAV